jgi:hypothetical protein
MLGLGGVCGVGQIWPYSHPPGLDGHERTIQKIIAVMYEGLYAHGSLLPNWNVDEPDNTRAFAAEGNGNLTEQIEILALRHQLAVLQRTKRRRAPIRATDRPRWIALCRLWPEWRKALVLVKPDTVIRWHRRGFWFYWK